MKVPEQTTVFMTSVREAALDIRILSVNVLRTAPSLTCGPFSIFQTLGEKHAKNKKALVGVYFLKLFCHCWFKKKRKED